MIIKMVITLQLVNSLIFTFNIHFNFPPIHMPVSCHLYRTGPKIKTSNISYHLPMRTLKTVLKLSNCRAISFFLFFLFFFFGGVGGISYACTQMNLEPKISPSTQFFTEERWSTKALLSLLLCVSFELFGFLKLNAFKLN